MRNTPRALALAVGLAFAGAAMAATTTNTTNTTNIANTTRSNQVPSTTAPAPAADTTTLGPSNLTSGTANSLPTGGDNTTTAATPAPFNAGNGTVLGGPIVGAPATEDYVVGPNGERIPVDRTNETAAAAGESVVANSAASRALDAKLAKDARDTRERVARKGQVLNSVAPRTNVDRTDQMPDDQTPLLSPSRR